MGVYIKGMNMPKGCATCPYCDRAWNKPKCKAKSMQGRFMEQKLNLDRTRQKWCPLIPAPPHGRLIEKNAVFELIRSFPNVDRQLPVEFMKALYELPTIIPAEEGE